MLIKTGERREEFGCLWEWRDPDQNMRGHWKSVEGNLVLIFPPSDDTTAWYVDVCDEELYEIKGSDVEQRAFASGRGFVHQDRSRSAVLQR